MVFFLEKEWFDYFLLYTLTRICSVEYTKEVEPVFEIIAEPNHRFWSAHVDALERHLDHMD
jgi:hypothetical protein